jgi:hypothetical protein
MVVVQEEDSRVERIFFCFRMKIYLRESSHSRVSLFSSRSLSLVRLKRAVFLFALARQTVELNYEREEEGMMMRKVKANWLHKINISLAWDSWWMKSADGDQRRTFCVRVLVSAAVHLDWLNQQKNEKKSNSFSRQQQHWRQ